MPRWPRSARSSNRAGAWSIRRTRPNGTSDAIAPAVTRGEAMTPTAHAVEAHGARIPLIGLGTWDLRGRACARLAEQALRLGYRHIDTAEMYDNEREVAKGCARPAPNAARCSSPPRSG